MLNSLGSNLELVLLLTQNAVFYSLAAPNDKKFGKELHFRHGALRPLPSLFGMNRFAKSASKTQGLSGVGEHYTLQIFKKYFITLETTKT